MVSCNLAVGSCEFRQVQEIFTQKVDRLVHLKFQGKVLRATENHPFYVIERKDWVDAQDLRIGNHLLSISGEPVSLEGIEIEEGDFQVYNLDVQGNHNYYACDVLVHNCSVTVASSAISAAGGFSALAGVGSAGLGVVGEMGSAVLGAAIGPVGLAVAGVGTAAYLGWELHEYFKGENNASNEVGAKNWPNTFSVGHYPSADQLDRLLGTNKGDFHRKMKGEIISDHAKDLQKNGIGRNPDIGYDKKTNKITFKDKVGGREYQSDTPIDNYKD